MRQIWAFFWYQNLPKFEKNLKQSDRAPLNGALIYRMTHYFDKFPEKTQNITMLREGEWQWNLCYNVLYTLTCISIYLIANLIISSHIMHLLLESEKWKRICCKVTGKMHIFVNYTVFIFCFKLCKYRNSNMRMYLLSCEVHCINFMHFITGSKWAA